jgi:hypothetical protein
MGVQIRSPMAALTFAAGSYSMVQIIRKGLFRGGCRWLQAQRPLVAEVKAALDAGRPPLARAALPVILQKVPERYLSEGVGLVEASMTSAQPMFEDWAAHTPDELSRQAESNMFALMKQTKACAAQRSTMPSQLPTWGGVLPLAGIYWWAMAADSGHRWSRGQVQDILDSLSQEEVRDGCVAYWAELDQVREPEEYYDVELKGFFEDAVEARVGAGTY